jgi:hypothetical protein
VRHFVGSIGGLNNNQDGLKPWAISHYDSSEQLYGSLEHRSKNSKADALNFNRA